MHRDLPALEDIECKICRGGVHSGALCPKHKGLVHHKHCVEECEFFIPLLWRCRYPNCTRITRRKQ